MAERAELERIINDELGVELTLYKNSDKDARVDAQWRGKHTTGRIWVRGTGLTFVHPWGGVVDCVCESDHTDGKDSFLQAERRMMIRERSLEELILELQHAGNRTYVFTKLEELKSHLVEVGCRFADDSGIGNKLPFEQLLRGLEERTKSAPDMAFIHSHTYGSDESISYVRDHAGMIEELEWVNEQADKHNVTFEWC